MYTISCVKCARRSHVKCYDLTPDLTPRDMYVLGVLPTGMLLNNK